MTSPTIRKASGVNAKPLVGLYAESGCGKTKGALLIAKGFTGDMSKVLMIETEAGRGEAWAEDPELGGYNVISLIENFSQQAYYDALIAAQRAGMKALIIDSASHEWEGPGGVLEQASNNEKKGLKGRLIWAEPKMTHKRKFILPITQTTIDLVIVCMRAKFDLIEVVGEGGKKDMKRATVPSPTQSDDILSEMFVHGWIDKAHVFHGTKYTLDSFQEIFVDGEALSVDTGVRLAAWAEKRSPAYITAEQVANLETLCQDANIAVDALKNAARVDTLQKILGADYTRALGWIEKKATASAGASTGQ